jgi:hypothetical protein
MTKISALAILAAIGAVLTPHASAQDKAQIPGEPPSVLFVQTAGSSTYKDGVLTMRNVAPMTVFFTDRPRRVTGHLRNGGFLKGWSEGQNSFKNDPPNATLSVFGGGERPTQAVVVLTNPRVDGNAIAYEARVLEGDLPAQGGESTLFIDGAGSPCSPEDNSAYGYPCWAQDAFSQGHGR